MSNTTYTPGIQNSPFGLLVANPQGSQYAAESGFTTEETILLRKAVREAIFDAAPAQYNALKLVFAKDPLGKASDEFEYLEQTFGRTAPEAASGVAAAAPSAGNVVTHAFDLTAGTISKVSVDLIITYPGADNEGVIQSISGVTITVASRTSAGLPIVATGDKFAIRSTIDADGSDQFSNYERLETITRYNYIQWFLRAKRWDRVELQKFENTGTTNYITQDKKEKLKQLRIDLFASYFNGHRGEYQISGSRIAKSMGGIFPTMLSAGSLSANPTVAGLKTSFEQLAFATNFKVEGATRFVYGTQEMLYEFSKIYKQPGLRYTPNNHLADLELNEIEFGGMKWVLVPCELFREDSVFPAEWKRRLLFIDQDSISPCKMDGIPALEIGSTLARANDGTRENFKDWWCSAQLSLEFNNPLGCFYIDVQ